jgi:flagellar biosynthesis/type III secretory pathway protein FliH
VATEAQRQIAADARKVLKQARDQGCEEGERLGYEKGVKASSRQALLEMHAAGLLAAANLVDDEPAMTAFKEAASILTDLAEQGADGVGRRVKRQAVTSGG